MIEGKHFRDVAARGRTLGEAIDRYLRDEVPEKLDCSLWRANLLWWKKKLGRLKPSDVGPAILARRPLTRRSPARNQVRYTR
jgi:hypothetical protein